MLKNFVNNFKFYFGLFFKLYLVFISFFAIFRLIFIGFYWDKIVTTNASIGEIFYALISALKLDIHIISSTTILITWVFLLLHSIFKRNFFIKLARFYVFLIGIFYLLLANIELGIYNEWGEKPGLEILTYLKHPLEAFHTAPLGQLLFLLSLLAIFTVFFYQKTKKIFKLSKQNRSWIFIPFFMFITPVLIIIIARGGMQAIPISQSDAYYSKHKILNDIAVNTTFNFLDSIIENRQILADKNPYATSENKTIKQQILKPYLNNNCTDDTPKILTTSKPNIVLVIMESFSGDFIEPNNRENSIIPEYMNLTKQGILLKKVYGSGTLSHEGIPAILSGWPALDDLYVTNSPQKFNHLPSITEKLKSKGYSSLFIFGGDLNYGNLKSYIYKNKFDIILEDKNIKKILPNLTPGALGYHDKPMLHLLNQLTDKAKQPFFNGIFTVSSHSPYDQPLQNQINFGDNDKDYYNSVYYTDKSIKSFIDEAKTKSWYKNTLFIFVSDHSHKTNKNWSRANPAWHHIPMLFYGEVIKPQYRGTVINKIIAQHDLASTLLNQLDIDNTDFKFSRNFLCKDYQPGAYYATNSGYGFISPKGAYAYNIRLKREVYKSGTPNKKLGHYYLENLFDEFINLSNKSNSQK